MRKVLIELCTDNAAFDNDTFGEVSRILHDKLSYMRIVFLYGNAPNTNYTEKLKDINGNTVGAITIRN